MFRWWCATRVSGIDAQTLALTRKQGLRSAASVGVFVVTGERLPGDWRRRALALRSDSGDVDLVRTTALGWPCN